MKSTSDSADKVGKIIRLAGFESPGKGLTERIMNRIEVATIKRSLVFKPVIGFRGWVLIAVFVMILLILSYFLPGNSGNDAGTNMLDSASIIRRLQGIDINFHFNFQVSKVLLLGLTGLLFWIGMDYIMVKRQWKKHSVSGIKRIGNHF
jgi:hypothetical protein